MPNDRDWPRTLLTSYLPTADSCFALERTVKEYYVEEAQRLIKSRDMRIGLGEALGVSLWRVSNWLAGNYLPSNEETMGLRAWVIRQKACAS